MLPIIRIYLSVFTFIFFGVQYCFGQALLQSAGGINSYNIQFPANLAGTIPAGIMFTFKAHQTNSSAATITLNSVGPNPILKNSSLPLTVGDITSNSFVTVIYDGTNWQMLSVPSNASTAPNEVIQNQNAIEQSGTFRISGNGSLGSSLSVGKTNADLANSPNKLEIWSGSTSTLNFTKGTVEVFSRTNDGGSAIIGHANDIGTDDLSNQWAFGALGSYETTKEGTYDIGVIGASNASSASFGGFFIKSTNLTENTTRVYLAGPSNNAGIFFGNVGINTDAPTTDLHVNGGIRIENLAGPGGLVSADAGGNLAITGGTYVQSSATANRIPYMLNAINMLSSPLQTDGSNISIGVAPVNNYLFRVEQSSSTFPAIYAQSSVATGNAIWAYNNNVTAGSSGIRGVATGAGTGVYADNSNVSGYALFATGRGYFGGNVGVGTSAPGTVAGAARYLTLAHGETYSGSQISSFEMVGSRNALNTEFTKIDLINFNTPVPTITNSARISAFSGNATVGHGQLVFYTNNGSLTEKMRLSEAGRLGIGLNPSANVAQLQVSDLANSAGQIRVWAGTATGETGTDGLLINMAGGGASIQNYEPNSLTFGTGGSATMMTLLPSGNLGLRTGVSTPANKFSVDGNASIGTNYFTVAAPTNGMIIEGSLGIGNSTPSTPLYVRAPAVAATAETIATFDIGDGGGSLVEIGNSSSTNAIMEPLIRGNMIGSNNSFVIQGITNNDAAGGPMVLIDSKFTSAALSAKPLFGIANNAILRMIMLANGNVGLGTNNPGAKLDVAGNFKLGINGTVLNNFIQGCTTTGAAFGNVAANTSINVDFALANTATIDKVWATSAGLVDGLVIQSALIFAANTVRVRVRNLTGGLVSLNSQDFCVIVIKP